MEKLAAASKHHKHGVSMDDCVLWLGLGFLGRARRETCLPMAAASRWRSDCVLACVALSFFFLAASIVEAYPPRVQAATL